MDLPTFTDHAARRPHRRIHDHRRHPCGASARPGPAVPGAPRWRSCTVPRSGPVFNSDETFLATQAHVIQEGGQLYEEATDRKPPLVPYIYAARRTRARGARTRSRRSTRKSRASSRRCAARVATVVAGAAVGVSAGASANVGKSIDSSRGNSLRAPHGSCLTVRSLEHRRAARRPIRPARAGRRGSAGGTGIAGASRTRSSAASRRARARCRPGGCPPRR